MAEGRETASLRLQPTSENTDAKMTRYVMYPYGSVKGKEGHALHEGNDMPPWWPFDDNHPRRFDLRTRTWTLLERNASTTSKPTVHEINRKIEEENRLYLEKRQRELEEWLMRLDRMLGKYYDVIDQGRPEIDVDAFMYLIAVDGIKDWESHARSLADSGGLQPMRKEYESWVIPKIDKVLLEDCRFVPFSDGFTVENIPLVMLGNTNEFNAFCELGPLVVSKRELWSRLIHLCRTSTTRACVYSWQKDVWGEPVFQDASLKVEFHWGNELSYGDLDKYVPVLGLIEQALYDHRLIYKGPARLHFAVTWVHDPSFDEPTIRLTLRGRAR